MAINIDTVYQKVLAVANKEQRGYINPQQFNLFANQAQLDIFEDYFFKLNELEFGQKNDTQYADLKTILLEKIQPFETVGALEYINTGLSKVISFREPSDIYRIGSIRYLSVQSNLCTDSNFTDATSSEMLTNGALTASDSATPSGWIINGGYVGGTTISSNKLHWKLPTFNFEGALVQNYTSLASGTKFYKDKTYRVTFTISDHLTGGLGIRIKAGIKNNSTSNYPEHYAAYIFTDGELGDGTYTIDIKPDYPALGPALDGLENGISFFYNQNMDGPVVDGSPVNFKIDDISVREVGNEWVTSPANSWHFGNEINYNNSSSVPNWIIDSTNIQKAWADKVNEPLSSGQQANITNIDINPRATHGFLQNAMTLVEGNTYELSFKVGAATAGNLLLANHLNQSNPAYTIADGTSNNMPLWGPKAGHQAVYHGQHTRYFVQGSSNTDKLSIYRDKHFDGYIANVTVKQISGATNGVEVQSVRGNELTDILNSKLVQPTLKRPIYIRNSAGIIVYPTSITDGVSCYYIRKPQTVSWNYTEVNSVALFNSGSSVDFELHESEENTLVSKILVLAGINIKDQALTQIGMAKEAQAK
tara:strand:+ start:53 stop:1825 length:1773 start_codon:yes stop_codon:yes gene_type:complete